MTDRTPVDVPTRPSRRPTVSVDVGGVLVGDTVKLTLDVEAVKQ